MFLFQPEEVVQQRGLRRRASGGPAPQARACLCPKCSPLLGKQEQHPRKSSRVGTGLCRGHSTKLFIISSQHIGTTLRGNGSAGSGGDLLPVRFPFLSLSCFWLVISRFHV